MGAPGGTWYQKCLQNKTGSSAPGASVNKLHIPRAPVFFMMTVFTIIWVTHQCATHHTPKMTNTPHKFPTTRPLPTSHPGFGWRKNLMPHPIWPHSPKAIGWSSQSIPAFSPLQPCWPPHLDSTAQLAFCLQVFTPAIPGAGCSSCRYPRADTCTPPHGSPPWPPHGIVTPVHMSFCVWCLSAFSPTRVKLLFCFVPGKLGIFILFTDISQHQEQSLAHILHSEEKKRIVELILRKICSPNIYWGSIGFKH